MVALVVIFLSLVQPSLHLFAILLILQLHEHPRAKEVLDGNGGRAMLRTHVQGAQGWLVVVSATVLALMGVISVSVAQFAAALALLGSVRAGYGTVLFLRRFTVRRPQ